MIRMKDPLASVGGMKGSGSGLSLCAIENLHIPKELARTAENLKIEKFA